MDFFMGISLFFIFVILLALSRRDDYDDGYVRVINRNRLENNPMPPKPKPYKERTDLDPSIKSYIEELETRLRTTGEVTGYNGDVTYDEASYVAMLDLVDAIKKII